MWQNTTRSPAPAVEFTIDWPREFIIFQDSGCSFIAENLEAAGSWGLRFKACGVSAVRGKCKELILSGMTFERDVVIKGLMLLGLRFVFMESNCRAG